MSRLDQMEDLLMVSRCLLLLRIRFALLKQGRMYNDIMWTDVVGFFSICPFWVFLAFLDYQTEPQLHDYSSRLPPTQIAKAPGVCVHLVATLVLLVVELLRSTIVGVILVIVAIMLVVQLLRPLFGLVMCTQLIILVHA